MRGQKLDEAMNYARENFRRSPTLEEIGRHVGLSVFYLSRLFTQRFGTTPKKVMLELQIEEAKRLLDKGMLAQEVSAAAGFAHESHFAHRFRLATGVTPRQWPARSR
jgi:AraC-like DNA-binding protein